MKVASGFLSLGFGGAGRAGGKGMGAVDVQVAPGATRSEDVTGANGAGGAAGDAAVLPGGTRGGLVFL